MNLLVVGLLLPALLFALAYFPILEQSLVLVSPYAKADVRRRVSAIGLDGLLVMTCWIAYWNSGVILFAAAGLLYILLRDSIGGQSLGKFLVGLIVVHVDTGQRCRTAGSITRNVMLILPGINLAASVLETRTLLRDPQGQTARRSAGPHAGCRRTWRTRFRAEPATVLGQLLSELPRAAKRPDRVVADR